MYWERNSSNNLMVLCNQNNLHYLYFKISLLNYSKNYRLNYLLGYTLNFELRFHTSVKLSSFVNMFNY